MSKYVFEKELIEKSLAHLKYVLAYEDNPVFYERAAEIREVITNLLKHMESITRDHYNGVNDSDYIIDSIEDTLSKE